MYTEGRYSAGEACRLAQFGFRFEEEDLSAGSGEILRREASNREEREVGAKNAKQSAMR
jgi:hypothetical protein